MTTSTAVVFEIERKQFGRWEQYIGGYTDEAEVRVDYDEITKASATSEFRVIKRETLAHHAPNTVAAP